jgi:hypothetical protein
MSGSDYRLPKVGDKEISASLIQVAEDQLSFWRELQESNPELAREIERLAQDGATKEDGQIDVEQTGRAIRLAAFAVGVMELAAEQQADEQANTTQPEKRSLGIKLRELFASKSDTSQSKTTPDAA